MWILPRNLNLTDPSTSLAFVADTVASKEDLTLLAPTIESSLMWRSKPTPLRTWLTRWNRVSWMPHLFTRILKPSQHISFETALTSSLEATRANHLAQREGAREKKIPDISGHTSEGTLIQLDLLNASLKTSKDTSRLDSPLSSATWKKMVTVQRGEYSARLKSAHLTNANESTYLDRYSMPTPTVGMEAPNKNANTKGPKSLVEVAKGEWDHLFPTPSATAKHNVWPTPTVQDANKATKKLRDNHQNNLTAIVFNEKLPTPTSRDYKGGYKEESLTRKDGKSRRFDALPNAAIGGVGTDIISGHLNPMWIEWLMGVPTGLTELGCWETE